MNPRIREILFEAYKIGGEQKLRETVFIHQDYVAEMIELGIEFLNVRFKLTEQQKALPAPQETTPVPPQETTPVRSKDDILLELLDYIKHQKAGPRGKDFYKNNTPIFKCLRCGNPGLLRIVPKAGIETPEVYHVEGIAGAPSTYRCTFNNILRQSGITKEQIRLHIIKEKEKIEQLAKQREEQEPSKKSNGYHKIKIEEVKSTGGSAVAIVDPDDDPLAKLFSKEPDDLIEIRPGETASSYMPKSSDNQKNNNSNVDDTENISQ